MAGRIPVVFVEQVPWGGGAERVVYDLATGLDPVVFEPFITHLYDRPGLNMPFKSAVPLICVETDLPPVFGSQQPLQDDPTIEKAARVVPNEMPLTEAPGLLPWIQRIYRRLSPELRARIRLGEMIQKACQRFQSRTLIEEAVSVRNDMGRLNEILSAFPEEAVFVAVLEEPCVQLWINQAHRQRRWLAWLHTVESHMLPLLHLRQERLAVEKWLLANASRNAETVIMPSEGCREDLNKHLYVPAEHIRVIPNPLNVAAIIQQSQERPSLELPQSKILFVQVGRFQQEKNHRLLVNACRLLRQEEDDFAVMCLGEGPLRDGIQALVDEYDLSQHVFLPGAVANPYPFMAAARAAILTSDFESFALVLVEAMACGTIPVSVDCPVGPRDVLDGGKYGLLTPPGDPQALADAMLKIARDDSLHAHLKSLGQGRARQYDIDPIIRQWETLLQGTARQSTGGR